MNVKSGFVLSLLVLGLSACATTDDRTMRVMPQNSPSPTDTNEAYVAYVERVARRRGIEVVWVNTPTRRSVVAPEGE